MRTLERRNGILRQEVRMRLGPGESLGIKTSFTSQNIIDLTKPIPDKVIDQLESKIRNFKLKRIVNEEPKKVSLKELKAKKENSAEDLSEIDPEKYNPNKDLLDKQDRVNAIMQRVRVRRGRSGCRCEGDVKSSACRSRSCRNKDQEAKVIDIRGKSGQENRGSKRIRAGVSVVVSRLKVA